MGKNKGSKKKGSNEPKSTTEVDAKAQKKLDKAERRANANQAQEQQRIGDLIRQKNDQDELKRRKEQEEGLMAEEILQKRHNQDSINESNRAKAQKDPRAYREAREMKIERGPTYDRNTEETIKQMQRDALPPDYEPPPLPKTLPRTLGKQSSSSSSSMFDQGNKHETSSYQSGTSADTVNRGGYLDSYNDNQVYESNQTTIAESNERKEAITITQVELEKQRLRDEKQKFMEDKDIADEADLLDDFGALKDDDSAKTRDGNPVASVEQKEPKDEDDEDDEDDQFAFDTSNFQLDRGTVRRAFTTEVTQANDPSQTIDNQINGALALNTDTGFYSNTEKLSKFRSMEDRFANINKSKFNKELDLSRFRSSFGSTLPAGRTLDSLRQTPVSWSRPTRTFSNNFVGLIQQGVATQNKLSQEFIP